MNRAIIGLGSNIDPVQNIQKAKETLRQKFCVLDESCFKLTKPFGKIQQADFINGAVLMETELNIEYLKQMLQDIEEEMGRDRADDRHGPRTIDLDIIVWNNSITDQNFYERDYLKESVLELIPALTY